MALGTLLVPPVLLVAAPALAWGLGAAGFRLARPMTAGAAWLALLALAGGWILTRGAPFELATSGAVGVAPLVLRQDATEVLFEFAVLAPVTVLLTFLDLPHHEAALTSLSAAAAVGTLMAGSMLLTAFGLAMCVSLVLVLLGQPMPGRTWHPWVALTASWLLLVWTAGLLEVGGGTSTYGAVPVTAIGVPVFVTLALAAVVAGGLVPWPSWVSRALAQRGRESGAAAVALFVPLALYLLARAYGLGAGQWPRPWLHLVLSALGAATALGAAVRAQAAPSRRAFLAEAVPLAAGLALLALGVGTPLGLVAGMTAVLGVGLVAALAPLVPSRRDGVALLAVLAVGGAPPTVLFGGWLMAVQSALEAGVAYAFLSIAAAGAWLLGLAAAGRALRMPVPAGDEERGGKGALAATAAVLVAGVGLPALVALLAIPAAAGLMPAAPGTAQPGVSQAAILSAGSLGVSTASGGWSAVLLGGPLLLLGLAAAALARLRAAPTERVEPAVVAPEAVPAPLFIPPLTGVVQRSVTAIARLRLPTQYRSLFGPAALERAVTTGRPWFWAVATAALAIAVTR